MGKAKKKRTEQLKEYSRYRRCCEAAVNELERHNFDKLVKNGVIRSYPQ